MSGSIPVLNPDVAPVRLHRRDLTPGRLTDKLGITWMVYSEFSAL